MKETQQKTHTEEQIDIPELLAQLEEKVQNTFTQEERNEFNIDKNAPWFFDVDKPKSSYDNVYTRVQLSSLFNSELDYYHPFQGKHFHIIKRLIRKIGACVIVPLVEKQMFINCGMRELLFQEHMRVDQLEERVVQLEGQLSALKKGGK